MNDDEFKKAFDFDSLSERKPHESESSTQKVVSRLKRQQSQGDLLNFGFVKLWTVVLEFFSIFYVQAQKKQLETAELNEKNEVKDELRNN